VSADNLDDDRDALLGALFASDLAKDVRSEFNAQRDAGLSVNDATNHVVSHFRHLLDHPEEGPVVIIALAVLQSLERAPISAFRDAALELLNEDHGFTSRAGENAAFRREREHLRAKLITLLQSESRASIKQDGLDAPGS
jgi:hypothetical protein